MWVDFCILCGCDYSKRIKYYSPNKIIKGIFKYKNIEGILENEIIIMKISKTYIIQL